MIRRPPRPTRTDTLFPYTTLFRAKFVGDLSKPAVDLLRILRSDDSARAEHRGVRAAGGDIFFPQTLVDGNRCVNLLPERRGSATEAAAPLLLSSGRFPLRPLPDPSLANPGPFLGIGNACEGENGG